MTRRGSRPRTDFTTCDDCTVRVIYPRLETGKKMPPVDYGPDPIGTVAIHHKASGAYTGRWLAKDEQPGPHETRHAVHHCEGSERRRTHRRGRSANQRPEGGRKRRTQAIQPTLI